MTMSTPDQIFEDIAKRHLLVETLETRNSDTQDFYEVAVWCIKAALKEAFEAGQNAAAIDQSME
jgi:hypothetical protein